MGLGTFNVAGADADKPAAACVYLWTRDSALCDGPTVAGPGFNASLTEGQIILAAGAQCATSIGDIQAADIDALAKGTGDRTTALTALLTGLVYERYGGQVSAADVSRGEQAIVQGGFGGDLGAYESELASRGLNREIARGIIADGFRRQAIAATIAAGDTGTPIGAWIAFKHRQAWRSAICLSDQVPGKDAYSWSSLLPFLDLPEASVSITSPQRVIRKGTPLVLSGRVSSLRARETVTVFARGFDQVGFTAVGTSRVRADRSWSLQVLPKGKTTFYRAISLSAASDPIVVRIKRKR